MKTQQQGIVSMAKNTKFDLDLEYGQIREADEWFSINDHHFCLICDYANLDPSFIIRKYKQLKEANAKKLFRGKNLNKFLTHYICSFHEDPTIKNYYA